MTGFIAGMGGSCPNLSFIVGGVRVLTNSGTRFEKSACSTLQNGMQVEAEGERQADLAIMAGSIERKEEERPQEVKAEGQIAGLGGTCPNLSFSVNSPPVVTNAATRFKKVGCLDLSNGMRVEVEGV